jgi:hypothetical protein
LGADKINCSCYLPTGVYQLARNSTKEYILSFCLMGASSGGFLNVFTWNGKEFVELFDPWAIKGDVSEVKIQVLDDGQKGLLLSHRFSSDDLYICKKNKFLLRNDLVKYRNLGFYHGAYNPIEEITEKMETKLDIKDIESVFSISDKYLKKIKANSNIDRADLFYKSEIYRVRGEALLEKNEANSAFAEFRKASEIICKYQQDECEERIVATMYEKMGDVFWKKSNVENAYKYYKKSLLNATTADEDKIKRLIKLHGKLDENNTNVKAMRDSLQSKRLKEKIEHLERQLKTKY